MRQEQTPLQVWIETVWDAIAEVLNTDQPTLKGDHQREAARRLAWAWLIAQPAEVQKAVPAEHWDATIGVLFARFETVHDDLVRASSRASVERLSRSRRHLN